MTGIKELIEFNKFDEFVQVIKTKPFLDWKDYYTKDNLLHIAARSQAPINFLKILIEEIHIPINALNNYKETPLYIYFSNRTEPNYESVKFLLESKANPNLTPTKLTALYNALQNNYDYKYIELLIKHGASTQKLHYKLRGENLLHLACAGQLKKENLAFLLENGFSVNDKSSDGYTPFLLSLRNLHQFKLMLNYKPNMEAQTNAGLTALHIAALLHSPFEVFETLIKNGADVNKPNNKGYTPLYSAIMNKAEYDSVKLLINSGANIETQQQSTLLHLACENNSSFEILRLLLNRGTAKYINQKDSSGKTPLHLILLSNCDDLYKINLLLSEGANPKIKYSRRFPEELTKDKDVKDLLNFDISFIDDLRVLYKRKEETDLVIRTIDADIHVHSLILKTRLEEKYNDCLELLYKKNFEVANIFLYWIYTGKNKTQKDTELAKIVAQELKLNFAKMSQPEKVIESFYQLYKDEQSKDFFLLVQDESIKVHKLILLLRCDLYRSMFLCISNENTVKDFSGISLETMKDFIYYLYTDKLPRNVSQQTLIELENFVDFYQLNYNSSLPFRVGQRKRDMKMI